MDGTNEWDSREYEAEYARQCNLSYNRLLHREREKRGISQTELSKGILNRHSLELIEAGASGWTKLTGDTLMQRMGIATEYFEMVASGEELERWRMREDICLTVLTRPEEAGKKLQEYRRKYKRRVSIEEQFLGKVEILLHLSAWTAQTVWKKQQNLDKNLDKEELLRMGRTVVEYHL